MNEKYPKFIIEGDKLILQKVGYHKEIATDLSLVKGGGWFHFNSDTNTFRLSGESHDFGPAKLEDIQRSVDEGKVFFGNMLNRNISETHKFEYNTMTEIIPLN